MLPPANRASDPAPCQNRLHRVTPGINRHQQPTKVKCTAFPLSYRYASTIDGDIDAGFNRSRPVQPPESGTTLLHAYYHF